MAEQGGPPGLSGPGMSIDAPLVVGGNVVDPMAGKRYRGGMPHGRTLYVCSAGGPLGMGDGSTPYTPLASVGGTSGALSKLANPTVRSDRGDTIVCLPNHAEDITADSWSALSTCEGVTVTSWGWGIQRASLTWTVAGSTLLMDTDNFELDNFRLFLAGANAAGSALTVAAPITVSGNGCRISNCDIKWGFDADQIVGDGIIWTGDDGEFVSNRCFAATAAVPSNTFLTLTGADRMQIVGNWIKGATDATTRGVIDTETTACTDLLIANNYIANMLASSTIGLSCTANDTGIAMNNMFFVNSGILPITASELEWYNNYCCNGEGEAGALVGTASA